MDGKAKRMMKSRTSSALGRLEAATTARRLTGLTKLRPAVAVVLGSGFGHAIQRLLVEAEVPFAKLPGFPKPGISGHSGRVVFGWFGNVPVCVLSGRAHFYEGHSMEAVTFPIRVLAELGVRDVLLTNAAGGINRRFRAGDFMCLTDHINFIGTNPLRGAPAPGRDRFVDLTRTYDERLTKLVRQAAKRVRVKLYTGVYLAVSGPSYETPAEIRAFARLGADAVGMSTVPEAIVARHMGIEVLGVSCISNMAAGMLPQPLSEEEVIETTSRVRESFIGLLEGVIERL